MPLTDCDNQVLRAVTTYRSLVGYVSTTLLSRLITKKVWTNPQLWMGFMRCAKTIAPASFSALMQLPREQLKEILERQPEMKPGLWQYVLAKNGPVKAQTYAEVSLSLVGPILTQGADSDRPLALWYGPTTQRESRRSRRTGFPGDSIILINASIIDFGGRVQA